MELLFITNKQLCKCDYFKLLARASTLNNVRIILREKTLTDDGYLDLAQKAIDICGKDKIILNSKISVAEKLKFPSLQLSFPDFVKLPTKSRQNFTEIGVSVHSFEEARTAQQLGADFVIAGHIFPTNCKPDLPPRGISFLKEVREAFNGKLYAIGGINPQNSLFCKQTSADGVCVMSGFMQAENVFDYYETFLKAGVFDD